MLRVYKLLMCLLVLAIALILAVLAFGDPFDGLRAWIRP